MALEKITILDVSKTTKESKFKPGEVYTMVVVRDDKGRKISAFGDWAENWKKGDTIELDIEQNTYKDKDGFDQVSYKANNPNKQNRKFFPGSSGKNNVVFYSFLSAAFMAPTLLKDKMTWENFMKLQEKIEAEMKKKTSTDAPQSDAKPVKEVTSDVPTRMSDESKPAQSAPEPSEDDLAMNNMDLF